MPKTGLGQTWRRAVLRGGSWNNNGQNVRFAYRFRSTRAYRNYDAGFRLARSVTL